MIYPWQNTIWTRIIDQVSNDLLPHAILISGATDIGKLQFCKSFMQKLNCTQSDEHDQACGECNNCKLYIAGTHPDIKVLNIDEETLDQIKIDDIREINQFTTLSRQIAEYKILCINEAHLMNRNAANALLKSLEEPPPFTIIFLITDRVDMLLPTIKSRCQHWKLGVPDFEVVLQWLNAQDPTSDWSATLSIAGGRPLLAKKMHESGLGEERAEFFQDISQFLQSKQKLSNISAKHQNAELERLVKWQQSWCSDLVRCEFGNEPATLENPDFRRSLHSLKGRVDLHSLFRFMDKLIEFRRFSSAPLNKRLFIEDMLLRCREVLKQPA